MKYLILSLFALGVANAATVPVNTTESEPVVEDSVKSVVTETPVAVAAKTSEEPAKTPLHYGAGNVSICIILIYESNN